MVANIRGYTPNYGLKLINFDTPRWHTLEYSNWELVDAIMASTGLPGLRGEWINSTTYVVGERVFDNADGKIYGCLVTHTSAATGTFAADRALHPTYWLLATLDTPRYRGGWAPAVVYSVADIVFVNSYVYYICIANHTSSATFPPDAAKWSVVFDATAAVNSTNASATAAAGSASAAATSATNAATSATNSQASAVESAAQAAKLYGTSTSSVTIGVGGKSFATQASKYFNVGKFIMVRADADPVNQWMWGQVTSYSGTSLVINSMTSGGAGTYAAWTIDVSGSQGAIGPQGPQGELGPPLVIKGTVPTAAALPPTGNTLGDMYIAEDTQNLHIWDGTTWDNAGPLGTSTTTTADLPPSNPKDGDMWWESDTGIFWVRYDDGNSAQWIQAGGAAASINQNAVLKTGDTMTGSLQISPPSSTAEFVLNTATPSEHIITTRVAGVPRWNVRLGTAEAETGSNAGTNFYLDAYSDAGTFIRTPLQINRATGATALSSTVASTSPTTGALTVAGGLGVGGASWHAGDLTIDKATPAIAMKTTGATQNRFEGWKDNKLRWVMLFPDQGAESTGDVGSDFAINRYNDAGSIIGNALTIKRSTGAVNIVAAAASTSPTTGALTVAGGLGVGGTISCGNALYVQGTSGTDPVVVRTIGVAIGNGAGAIYSRSPNAYEIASTLNSAGVISLYSDNGTINVAAGLITVTGATASYGTTSDARLKEDLKSFDAGNIIDDTEVYDFKWKETSERAYGVLAQQASQVYQTPFFHDEKEDRHFVDYSKYVPVLLQELKALRARVAELEGRTTDKPTTTPKRGRS